MGKRGRSHSPGLECIPKALLFLRGSCLNGASSLLFRGQSASAAFWTPARLFWHLPWCFRFPHFLMFTLNFPLSLGVILLTSLVFLLTRKGGRKELTTGGGETQPWLFTEGPVLSAGSSGLLESWLPLLTPLYQCLSQPHPRPHAEPPTPVFSSSLPNPLAFLFFKLPFWHGAPTLISQNVFLSLLGISSPTTLLCHFRAPQRSGDRRELLLWDHWQMEMLACSENPTMCLRTPFPTKIL